MGELRQVRDALADQLLARALDPSRQLSLLSDAADKVLGRLLTEAVHGDLSRVALIAVGGYGTGSLWPGSDLDVMLVHQRRRDFRAVAEHVWYGVWDSGVRLDHSVRTPKEALAVARDDLPAMLGLLRGRMILGDYELASRLLVSVKEVWTTHARRYLPMLADSSEARVARFGEVCFLLEPDLKESRGGLRDLGAVDAAVLGLELLEPSVRREELASAARILRSTRSVLHAATGSSSDRLLLQDQDQVAPVLGFGDADELMAAVAAAGRAVLWSSEETWRRARSWCAGPPGRGHGRDVALAENVLLRDGEVALPAVVEVSGHPELVLRTALAAASSGRHIAPATLARLEREATPPPEPWSDQLRDDFVSLLGCGDAAVAVIETLDRFGLFEQFVPEWGSVRNRPQRNALHRYTVDRHLLETAARAADLVREVSRPDLLLLSALWHDMGKATGGDHSRSGSAIAARAGKRMGLGPVDAATLGRVVALHLMLPEIATRRDPDDPATARRVADAVGDRPTLDLLAALATADGLATGSTAWSPWKAGLVGELVGNVAGVMEGTPLDHTADRSPELLARYADLLARKSLAVRVSDRSGNVLRPGTRAGNAVVAVVARDVPGLLATVAGTLALSRLEILRALAPDVTQQMALEVFDVEVASGLSPDPARIEVDLGDALSGRLLLEARLETLERAYSAGRRAASSVDPAVKVLVDLGASAAAAVVEVRAPDRHGLLHRLAKIVADEGLDIASAHVATLGHEVVDTFYVRDGLGGKVTDVDVLSRLSTQLEAAASRGLG